MHNTAWFEQKDNSYHIKHISSFDRGMAEKDLTSMTIIINDKKQYLLPSLTHDRFKWYDFAFDRTSYNKTICTNNDLSTNKNNLQHFLQITGHSSLFGN